MGVTWKPHERHGELTERVDLPDTVFAFPTVAIVAPTPWP